MKKVLSLMALCLFLGAHSNSAHAAYPNDLWKFLPPFGYFYSIDSPHTYAAQAILWAATFEKKPRRFDFTFNKPAIEANQHANLLKILSAVYENTDCLTSAYKKGSNSHPSDLQEQLEQALQQGQISLTKDGDVYTVTNANGDSATFTISLQKGEKSLADSYARHITSIMGEPLSEKHTEALQFFLNETTNFNNNLNKVKVFAAYTSLMLKNKQPTQAVIKHFIARLDKRCQKAFLEKISSSINLSNITPLLPYIHEHVNEKIKTKICESCFLSRSDITVKKEAIEGVLNLLKGIKDEDLKNRLYQNYFACQYDILDTADKILDEVRSFENVRAQASFYGNICRYETTKQPYAPPTIQRVLRTASLDLRRAMVISTIQAQQAQQAQHANGNMFPPNNLGDLALSSCIFYLQHPDALSIFGNGEEELNILKAISALPDCDLRHRALCLFFQHPDLNHDNAVIETYIADLLENTENIEIAIFCTGHILSNNDLKECKALELLNTAIKKYKDMPPESRLHLSAQLLKREIVSPALIHQEAELALKSTREIQSINLLATFFTSCIKHPDTTAETLTLIREQYPQMDKQLKISLECAYLERPDYSKERANTLFLDIEDSLIKIRRAFDTHPQGLHRNNAYATLRSHLTFLTKSFYNLCISYLKREDVDQTIINKIIGHADEQNAPILSEQNKYDLYKAYIESPHASDDRVQEWIDANPDSALAKNSRNRKKKRVSRPDDFSNNEPSAKKQRTE